MTLHDSAMQILTEWDKFTPLEKVRFDNLIKTKEKHKFLSEPRLQIKVINPDLRDKRFAEWYLKRGTPLRTNTDFAFVQ